MHVSFFPIFFSMRFPECFVAADEARELQKNIQDEIAHYIVKRSRPLSVFHKLRDNAAGTTVRYSTCTLGTLHHQLKSTQPSLCASVLIESPSPSFHVFPPHHLHMCLPSLVSGPDPHIHSPERGSGNF